MLLFGPCPKRFFYSAPQNLLVKNHFGAIQNNYEPTEGPGDISEQIKSFLNNLQRRCLGENGDKV